MVEAQALGGRRGFGRDSRASRRVERDRFSGHQDRARDRRAGSGRHEDGGRKAGKCPQLMNTERDDNFMLTRIAIGSEGKMPAFGAMLKGPDLQALLAYIHSLKAETK